MHVCAFPRMQSTQSALFTFRRKHRCMLQKYLNLCSEDEGRYYTGLERHESLMTELGIFVNYEQ